MNTHEDYMQRCLQLAAKGIGGVKTNPLVGSVVAYNGLVIGEGYHQIYGEAHAEVNAINNVTDKSLLTKSTLYVNLEPCAHTGKTPPCANLTIENKIPKVVIGCVDSFSEVAGKGIARMREAGVEVIVGVLEKDCRLINKRFFTFHEKKRPYVIVKWAQTQDGFISPTKDAHDKDRWITAKETQVLVHKWRAEEHAILVGRATVEMDNPSLTVREYHGENPVRVLIDKDLKIDKNKAIFNTEAKTIVINSVKDQKEDNITYAKIDFKQLVIPQVLAVLYENNIQSLIVEGGKHTIESFFKVNGVDEIRQLIGLKYLKEGLKAPEVNLNGFKKATENIGVDILNTFTID